MRLHRLARRKRSACPAARLATHPDLIPKLLGRREQESWNGREEDSIDSKMVMLGSHVISSDGSRAHPEPPLDPRDGSVQP